MLLLFIVSTSITKAEESGAPVATTPPTKDETIQNHSIRRGEERAEKQSLRKNVELKVQAKEEKKQEKVEKTAEKELRTASRSARMEEKKEEQAEKKAEHESEKATREAQREERKTESVQRKEERQQKASSSAERRSRVATAVQELLSLGVSDPGIGDQVREIAREHTEGVAKLDEQLQTIEHKNAVLKALFGPDKKGLEQAKEMIKQNNERVQRLQKLQSEITQRDPEAAAKMQEHIQQLQQANAEFDQSVVTSEQGFSLFGWAMRLFGR